MESRDEEHTAQQRQADARSELQAGGDESAEDRQSETAREAAEVQSRDTEAFKARIAELEQQADELQDQYLRKQADYENFRKRMLREKEDAIAFANKQLMLDLVTVIDDFERAIQSAEESRDFDSFHDGIVLIEKQLVGMLERKWALKRFDSAGEPFDPQRHEALLTEEVPEHDQSIVLEDFQKGYLLHDRVLRSAKVKVSLPAARS
ncbi:MAG: nucleotide exchange factor GrpE [Spirochaetaceae bacterium]|nr:MAG: nucleotide exchange factor GrpE [Spirochaetaceae bacterium]